MSKHLIIIGAPRCGTTTLAHILNAHPQVEMARPIAPEPKWFFQSDPDIPYEDLWKTSAPLKGEKTTNYLENYYAFTRIEEYFRDMPAPKIVICLRDPVHRAISNYHWSMSHGWQPKDESFESALLSESEYECHKVHRFDGLVGWWRYRKRGEYASLVQRWICNFKAHFMWLDEERGFNHGNQLGALIEYLEIDPCPEWKVMATLRSNTTNRHNHPLAAAFLAKYYVDWNEQLAELLHCDMPRIWNRNWKGNIQ